MRLARVICMGLCVGGLSILFFPHDLTKEILFNIFVVVLYNILLADATDFD